MHKPSPSWIITLVQLERNEKKLIYSFCNKNRIFDVIPKIALSLPQFYTMRFRNLQEKTKLTTIKVSPVFGKFVKEIE